MPKSSHILPKAGSKMSEVLDSNTTLSLPKVGELVSGTVVYVGKNEAYVDIDGVATGLIRGRELNDASGQYADLVPGQFIEATLLESENEYGLLELSLRHAGHQRAWTTIHELLSSGETTTATVIEANKGGLMVKVAGVNGFLPVSQLTSEHYPRVDGGDKGKIQEMLKQLVGKSFEVKIIDANEKAEKLIVSEKAAWDDKQQVNLAEYKPDMIVDGKVSGIVDFGIFVEFGEGLEGLVHISEMAWQRVDKPSDLFKIGDQVKTKIIDIDGSKISLSIKRVTDDPWKTVATKYSVGMKIKGKILKVNPFGLFVEVDPEIHGLAHISELGLKKVKDPTEIAKPGDIKEFFIISLDPESHRLGLSLREKKVKEDKETSDESEEKEIKQKKVKEKKSEKIKSE